MCQWIGKNTRGRKVSWKPFCLGQEDGVVMEAINKSAGKCEECFCPLWAHQNEAFQNAGCTFCRCCPRSLCHPQPSGDITWVLILIPLSHHPHPTLLSRALRSVQQEQCLHHTQAIGKMHVSTVISNAKFTLFAFPWRCARSCEDYQKMPRSSAKHWNVSPDGRGHTWEDREMQRKSEVMLFQ